MLLQPGQSLSSSVYPAVCSVQPFFILFCESVKLPSLCFFFQAGNIAELLLKEGFAWCVDWSMAMVTKEKEKLRAAEK